jgi:hypothetical protein
VFTPILGNRRAYGRRYSRLILSRRTRRSGSLRSNRDRRLRRFHHVFIRTDRMNNLPHKLNTKTQQNKKDKYSCHTHDGENTTLGKLFKYCHKTSKKAK